MRAGHVDCSQGSATRRQPLPGAFDRNTHRMITDTTGETEAEFHFHHDLDKPSNRMGVPLAAWHALPGRKRQQKTSPSRRVGRYLPSRLAPYLERACFRSATPCESRTPRMMW